MLGEERRKKILEKIIDNTVPVSAMKLAGEYSVSRQVIVQDIALLRAAGNDIVSTNRGYVINKNSVSKRVFKVKHSDSQIQEELYGIVDLGGCVEDVFINHKAYGRVRANLDINSRKKVNDFVNQINQGKSSPLKNITSDYHYHTVTADSEEVLDLIEENLNIQSFLIKK